MPDKRFQDLALAIQSGGAVATTQAVDGTITGLGEPVNGSDAATKNYVDSRPTSHLLGDDCILCLPLRVDAVDVGPNSFTVTNNGTVTFDSIAGASFNGTDQWLSIPSSVLLTPDGPISFAFSAQVDNFEAILSKIDDVESIGGYFVDVRTLGGEDTCYRLRGQNEGGSDLVIASTFPSPTNPAGERHWVVVSVDTDTGHVYIYVDGALHTIQQGVPDPIVPFTFVANDIDFLIGAIFSSVDGVTSLTEGTIGDVLVVGRTMSAGDAVAHWNEGNGQADGGLNVVVGEGGALLAVNNLSDLDDESATRTNLGLGTFAIQNNPVTTRGDLLVQGASVLGRLPVGNQGEVLTAVPTTHLLGDDCILCMPLRANKNDVGPNAFTVTDHGTVTYDATNGASFNGIDQWLEITHDALLNPSGVLTLAVTWNIPADGTTGGAPLIQKEDADFLTGWELWPAYVGGGTSGWEADFGFNNPGWYRGNNNDYAVDSAVTASLVFVLDPAASNVGYPNLSGVFFINGVDPGAVGGTGDPQVCIANALSLMIGKSRDGAALFKGTIRDLVLSSRAWTANDALAHYNGGSGHSDGGLDVEVNNEEGAQLAYAAPTKLIIFPFDGAGSPVAGDSNYPIGPFDQNLTIVGIVAFVGAGDINSTAVFDLWKSSTAAYPPDSGDSILGGGTAPTITAAKIAQADLTDYDVSLLAGDFLVCNVDSNNNANQLFLAIKVQAS